MRVGPRWFEHFVLTRFNPALPGDARGLDPDWLSHRMQLFERVCIPSLVRQTCQDFTWLVFCDRRTPPVTSLRLRALARDGHFEVVWCDGAFDDRTAAVAVEERVSDVTHVLTTRLDNDDALAPDFVANLQQRLVPHDRCFVNFPYGLQLAGGQTYARVYLGSPFLSLLEATGGPVRTVYSTDHWRPRQHRAQQVWTRDPAWLQVVHGRNLANEVKGLWMNPRRAAGFALPPELLAPAPPPLRAGARRLGSARHLLRPGDTARRLTTLAGTGVRWRRAP